MIEFGNPVVGQEELLRSAIRSENYVAGVSGWRIAKDGTAEFNSVTARGELLIGTPPSPPNAYIHGTVDGGVPMIALYDGTHANPARIFSYSPGTTGGIQIDSEDNTTYDSSFILGGDRIRLDLLDWSASDYSAELSMGASQGFDNIWRVEAEGGLTERVALGLDVVAAQPDGALGRIFSEGEIWHNRTQDDANYCARVVDGKAPPGGQVDTTIGAVDTNIASANIQNTFVEAGYAYRAYFHIDQRVDTLGVRLDYKLWKGALGGTQLGGTHRQWADFATATFFNGVHLYFYWKATADETIANLNLSALKGVGAGVAVCQVNAAYMGIVEKIGTASKISGL